ncbi:MAG: hypothetical protein PHN60_04845 [Candidatus Gracilibacteria bacterium]|nr:hypothetical protein [Candidatus Gracilibacteria bacterium]
MSDLLKRAKAIILSSDVKWQVRDFDDDHLMLIYVEEAKKADCGTSCCLGCLFFPVGIIYAILGGSNGSKKQLSIRLIDNELALDGDINSTLKAYKILKNSEIGDKIKETENIVKMEKTKNITTIVWVVLIVIIILIIASSGNSGR